MSESDSPIPCPKTRPEFRNVNVFSDLRTYRLPASGVVSILHRFSGVVMFLSLPLLVWLFDTSVSSEYGFPKFENAFSNKRGIQTAMGLVPGVLIKVVVVLMIWALLHHLLAGVRHLWLDIDHSASTKAKRRVSAWAVLVVSLAFSAALGAKLFQLY